MRSDWDTYRLVVMRNGIKAKFDQNSTLKTKLIGTYPNMLVEHSPYDMFWGDGHSNGLNWLGKLLVELRDSYIQEEKNKIEKKDLIKVKSASLLGKRQHSKSDKEEKVEGL